jgi:hypothetical protein
MRTFFNLIIQNFRAACLTINSYFSCMIFFFFDPIEQYDLGLLNVCGYTIYPVYLHIFLIVFVVS